MEPELLHKQVCFICRQHPGIHDKKLRPAVGLSYQPASKIYTMTRRKPIPGATLFFLSFVQAVNILTKKPEILMEYDFKKVNLLAILLVLSFFAKAQTHTVSGRVVSVRNGGPVIKATIHVKQQSKYFAADDEGNFILSLPSEKINRGKRCGFCVERSIDKLK